jgi:hypothetical protein
LENLIFFGIIDIAAHITCIYIKFATLSYKKKNIFMNKNERICSRRHRRREHIVDVLVISVIIVR